MLTYKIIERTEKVISYSFFPEGKGKPGRITFSTDGNVLDVVSSPDDEIGWCVPHARHIDITTDEGTVAWC